MKRAFTLSELLVVIMIILVLASLMLPAIIGAKRASSRPVCSSNMRQLYMAMKLYQGDHGEYPSINHPVDPVVRNPIADAFRTYYPKVLWCPESRNTSDPNQRFGDYTMLGFQIPNSPSTHETSRDAFLECRSIRSGSIPLVLDHNHMRSAITPDDRESRYYIVREDGSFAMPLISSRAFKSGPCDESKISSSYNF
jgi:prepilin-type N-terminal cleavage/methylation domain-containing protein